MIRGLLPQGAKRILNAALRPVGARIISTTLGPRGFAEALARVKKKGIHVNQVIDVGAARGEWTRECMRVFRKAEYFLVDPLTENGEDLAAVGRDYSNVKYWIGAVGSRDGRHIFRVHGDQSSFLRSEYAADPDGCRCVNVRTLDSLLVEGAFNKPDLIKADVQGYELEVLKGAEDCLKHASLVLLEVCVQTLYEDAPLAHDVIAFMGQRAFAVYDVCSYVQRPLDNELAYSDILFAKRDCLLFRDHGWDRAAAP